MSQDTPALSVIEGGAGKAPVVSAPFAADQVESMIAYQQNPFCDPLVCASRHHGDARVVLFPKPDGLHCSDGACRYVQDRAFAFMADWSWMGGPP